MTITLTCESCDYSEDAKRDGLEGKVQDLTCPGCGTVH